MSPEAQRIAILETMGWRCVACEEMKPDAWACWVCPGGNDWEQRCPPDPVNDLNAMAIAEATLTEKEEFAYLVRLAKEMREAASISCRNDLTFKASAPVRARAFLKVTGGWEDCPCGIPPKGETITLEGWQAEVILEALNLCFPIVTAVFERKGTGRFEESAFDARLKIRSSIALLGKEGSA